MAFGIFIYAWTIKPVKSALLTGEITGDISVLLGINHWFIIIPAAVLFAGIIWLANKHVSDDRVNF